MWVELDRVTQQPYVQSNEKGTVEMFCIYAFCMFAYFSFPFGTVILYMKSISGYLRDQTQTMRCGLS